MILLKETMENLLQQTNYPMKNKYDDAESNRLLNYWLLLDKRESLIQDLTWESLETVLYSKYYWSSRLIDRYTSLYGSDAGMEQCRYKILDEMDREFHGAIDWEVVERLEKDTDCLCRGEA